MTTDKTAASPPHRLGRTRWAAIGAAIAVTIGAGGAGLVGADVQSGERPVLVAIDPCRLADTRAGAFNVGPISSPVTAGSPITIDAQQSGTPCSGKIPADATALAMNVTALDASTSTVVTIWSGPTVPGTASLNPAPGQPPTPNAVTTSLANDGSFTAANAFGTLNLVFDVVGYYVDHNHDDRYFTKAQVNAIVAEAVAAVPRTGTNDVLVAESGDFRPSTDGTKWTFGGAAFHSTASATQECIVAPVRAAAGTTNTSVSVRYTSVTGTTNGLVSLTGITTTPGPADFGGSGTSSLVNDNVEFFSDSSGVMRNVEVLPTATPTFVDGHAMTLQLCTSDPALAIVRVIVNTV